MKKAPRGVRVVIAVVGRRNVGKSSFINAVTGQQIAIVSDTPGTTTDPVAKPFELVPVGPVTFYDTAGIDDSGDLGAKRVKATRKILWRADIAIFVVDRKELLPAEKEWLDTIKDLKIPIILVANKIDQGTVSEDIVSYCTANEIPWVAVSSETKTGLDRFMEALVQTVPSHFKEEPALVGDLFDREDTVVLVAPIDASAPKGRLILPQVQVIREILDRRAVAVVAQENQLQAALEALASPPALVITDSQVVLQVARQTPESIPMTTFSILFARHKGDLAQLVAGADVIDRLQDGDAVLIAEACSHHAQEDDIGRVKIPNWMKKYTGKALHFDVASGHDFPEDLDKYKLIVHCGSCMLNRMEMQRRITETVRRQVPITNYGVAISKLQGVLDRVIRPFGL
ncbi:MAG: [FeFe] hydrogenase H-cluster maturation GTPase HydF [bacterium]